MPFTKIHSPRLWFVFVFFLWINLINVGRIKLYFYAEMCDKDGEEIAVEPTTADSKNIKAIGKVFKTKICL